jgi:flavin-dependent dehydrogenase
VARFDVAIVGGGPAGSSLAWLLARAGARIVLLDDGRHRPSAPRETLLAAAEPGLERAGLWQFAAAAAVPDPFRHGAIWGSDELVWR